MTGMWKQDAGTTGVGGRTAAVAEVTAEGGAERRWSGLRAPLDVLVALGMVQGGPGFEAQGMDLSLGGLRLRSAYLPSVGDRLVARFGAPEGIGWNAQTEIELLGQVVWARELRKGCEFALSWVNVLPETGRALESLWQALLVARGPVSEADPVQATAGGAHPGQGVADAGTAPLPSAPVVYPDERVRLHVPGLGAPMRARVRTVSPERVEVGSSLEFLQLGKAVELEKAELEKLQEHGISGAAKREAWVDSIHVELEASTGVPQLLVGLRYQRENDLVLAPELPASVAPEVAASPVRAAAAESVGQGPTLPARAESLAMTARAAEAGAQEGVSRGGVGMLRERLRSLAGTQGAEQEAHAAGPALPAEENAGELAQRVELPANVRSRAAGRLESESESESWSAHASVAEATLESEVHAAAAPGEGESSEVESRQAEHFGEGQFDAEPQTSQPEWLKQATAEGARAWEWLREGGESLLERTRQTSREYAPVVAGWGRQAAGSAKHLWQVWTGKVNADDAEADVEEGAAQAVGADSGDRETGASWGAEDEAPSGIAASEPVRHVRRVTAPPPSRAGHARPSLRQQHQVGERAGWVGATARRTGGRGAERANLRAQASGEWPTAGRGPVGAGLSEPPPVSPVDGEHDARGPFAAPGGRRLAMGLGAGAVATLALWGVVRWSDPAEPDARTASAEVSGRTSRVTQSAGAPAVIDVPGPGVDGTAAAATSAVPAMQVAPNALGESQSAPGGLVRTWGNADLVAPITLKWRLDQQLSGFTVAKGQDGFTVRIPGAAFLQTTTELASRDPRIAAMNLRNDDSGAELSVRFRDVAPPLFVEVRGSRLELSLGR